MSKEKWILRLQFFYLPVLFCLAMFLPFMVTQKCVFKPTAINVQLLNLCLYNLVNPQISK